MSEELSLAALDNAAIGHASVSRRSVVQVAAWTAPAILIATQHAAAAASHEVAATISLSNIGVNPNASTGILTVSCGIQVAQGTAKDFLMMLTLPDTATFQSVASPWVAATPSAVSGGRTQFLFVLSSEVTGPAYTENFSAVFDLGALTEYEVRFKSQASSAGVNVSTTTVRFTVGATE